MMSLEPVHPMNFMPHHAQPTALDPVRNGNEAVDPLASMFPDIERDVLSQMLAANGGNAEQTIDVLLAGSSAAPDSDIELARSLQAQQDAEVAKVLHDSLQRELKAEAEQRWQTSAPAKAAAATVQMADRAKAFLQRVRAKKPPSEIS